MYMETMKKILEHAYQHPSERNFFYSANSENPNSDKLCHIQNWDWTPVKSLGISGSSVGMFPISLGCEKIKIGDDKEWIRPFISEPEQVDKLMVPDVYDGQTGVVLANLKKMTTEIPAEHQIRAPDIQSPLEVAKLIWDESFYFILLENPVVVHKLLKKITKYIIAFIKEIHRIAGARLNGAGFPRIWANSEGTMISDDTMSLISPKMHREFSIPYLNEISDQCGPIFYHSCTWRKPYFDNIHQIRNVKAYNWNPGNSDDPAEIIREFSGPAVLAPLLVMDMHKDNDVLKFSRAKKVKLTDEADLLKYMIEAMAANTCMYVWLSNIIQKSDVIDKIYELLDRRGFTPQARGVA